MSADVRKSSGDIFTGYQSAGQPVGSQQQGSAPCCQAVWAPVRINWDPGLGPRGRKLVTPVPYGKKKEIPYYYFEIFRLPAPAGPCPGIKA